MEKSGSKKDNKLIKYNGAIQVSNNLNLESHKCFNVLYHYFFQDYRDTHRKKQTHLFDLIADYPHLKEKDLKEQSEYSNFNIGEMKLTFLMDKLGIKSNNIEYVKNILRGLANTTIEFNILDENGNNSWGCYSILSAVKFDSGIMRFEIPSLLIEHLIQAKTFTQLNLSTQNKISNRHALTLYENGLKWFDVKRGEGYSPKLTVEQLRKLFTGSEKKYPTFKKFNSKIIKSAVKIVNEISEIYINIKYFREQRQVKYIQFHITKNRHSQEKKSENREVSNKKFWKDEKGYEYVSVSN